MTKLTYKEAFDKITEAYIKGEIKPYERQFCFCGTLGSTNRFDRIDWDCSLYDFPDYKRMEAELLDTIACLMTPHIPEMEENRFAQHTCNLSADQVRGKLLSHANYEGALFAGMCAALEVLKQIHKERGENVEDFQFTKRQLKTCI